MSHHVERFRRYLMTWTACWALVGHDGAAVPAAALLNRRNLESSTHRHADHPGKVLTHPNGAPLRHNRTMGGGGGFPQRMSSWWPGSADDSRTGSAGSSAGPTQTSGYGTSS